MAGEKTLFELVETAPAACTRAAQGCTLRRQSPTSGTCPFLVTCGQAAPLAVFWLLFYQEEPSADAAAPTLASSGGSVF